MKVIQFLILFLMISSANAGDFRSVPFPRVITQSEDGAIWVGTQNNVLKYDGLTFHPVAQTDSYVRRIIPTASSTYVLTDNTLSVLHTNANFNTLFSYENLQQLPNQLNTFLDLAINKNGVYVLAHNRLLVFSLSNELLKTVPLAGTTTLSLLVSNDETICANLATGVSCFDATGEIEVQYNYDNPTSPVLIGNKLYVVTNTGLHLVDIKSSRENLFLQGVKLGSIAASTAEHVLWVEQDHQLKLFDLRKRHFVPHKYVRNVDSNILQIFESKDNTVWVASGILEKLNQSHVMQFNVGLPANTGMAWLFKHQGKLYAADEFGLVELDLIAGTSTALNEINNQISKRIFTAYSDEQHVYLGGLFHFNRINIATQQVEPLVERLPNNIVQCIKPVGVFTLGVCTSNGALTLLQTDTTESEVLPSDTYGEMTDVLTIKDEYWQARGKGVLHSAGNETEVFIKDESILKLHHSLYYSDWLYAGSQHSGVYRINTITKNVRQFDLGVLGNKVHDFAEYEDLVWIATSEGLAVINQSTDTLKLFPLGTSVGRIYNDNGTFYAIAANGKLLTWQNEIVSRAVQPDIIVAELLIDGTDVKNIEYIRQKGWAQFQVYLSDYQNSFGHEYAFNVNNSGWSKQSHSPHISFSPRYGLNRIKINAWSVSGEFVESHYDFYIEKPFYISWLAMGVYMFVLLNALLFIMYHRYHAKRHRNKMTRRLYEKHHHHTASDLSASITPKISVLHCLIEDARTEQALVLLSEIEEEMYMESQKAPPSTLLFADLTEAVKHYFMLNSFKSDCDVEIDIPPMAYNPDQFIPGLKNYIYTVIFEAANNAMEYSGASHLYIGVHTYPNHINVTIRDDGKGIARESLKFPGLGLYEIKLIAGLLKAKLVVDTTFSGTEILLDIPVRTPTLIYNSR